MSVIVKGMEMPKNCAECERWSICECLKEYNDYESVLYAVDDGDLVRDANCLFAGVAEADCPKWECDNPTMDCENCEFLKEYKRGVTE